MRVPFRQQATKYDCTPTSIINALCYLFNREDLPPFIVQRIYKDCLDVESARGTSSRAIQDLAFLFKNYREKKFKNFSLNTKLITAEDVHLRGNSKIIRCIKSNGVAVLCVHLNRKEWHSILGFKADTEWLYCYDPAPRTRRFIVNDAVQFIETTKQYDPNLKIRRSWLDNDFDTAITPQERKYIFGDIDDRECLLLNRLNQ
jgi:hypothetical protein